MNTIIAGIVAQHAEEAADLWAVRDRCTDRPDLTLRDLARWDERVEAHLDGLRVAGEEAWGVCQEVLPGERSGEVFALASLALETKHEARLQEVVTKATASPVLTRGLVSALGWLPFRRAEPWIRQFLTAPSPTFRRVGVAAAAVHRHHPGRSLTDALHDPDPRLRARAVRAAGELGAVNELPEARAGLGETDPSIRFASAWSLGLRVPDTRVITALRSFAESDLPCREKALQVAARRMEPSAFFPWLHQLAQRPSHLRLAVRGAGARSSPELVPWLLDQMKSPKLARLCGEAFTLITGLDLSSTPFKGQQPEGFESGPSENPEEENVEMDADDDLPWPDLTNVRQWWDGHQGVFPKGARYLLGKPIEVEWLDQVLRTGRQRQRAAAALELALLQPGTPLFEVRAPGFRQQQILGLTGAARG